MAVNAERSSQWFNQKRPDGHGFLRLADILYTYGSLRAARSGSSSLAPTRVPWAQKKGRIERPLRLPPVSSPYIFAFSVVPLDFSICSICCRWLSII
jgi:hypothetical protein